MNAFDHGTEHGATAVEYALLASLIGAVILLTVTGLGRQVLQLFQSIEGAF